MLEARMRDAPFVIPSAAKRSRGISYYSPINNERCLDSARHDKTRVPEQQLAMFNVARRKHELRSTITFGCPRRNDEARMPNDE